VARPHEGGRRANRIAMKRGMSCKKWNKCKKIRKVKTHCSQRVHVNELVINIRTYETADMFFKCLYQLYVTF
jgi:hypothetical protein